MLFERVFKPIPTIAIAQYKLRFISTHQWQRRYNITVIDEIDKILHSVIQPFHKRPVTYLRSPECMTRDANVII